MITFLGGDEYYMKLSYREQKIILLKNLMKNFIEREQLLSKFFSWGRVFGL